MTSTPKITNFVANRIRHGYSILCAICVSGFCLSILINYPGFMSWDSANQLIEAKNGLYSDTFPPFMALLWHFTDRIIQGPLGMLLLMSALIWLGTFLVTLYWFNKDQFTPLSLLPAFIVFYPPLFGISGAIWKDNLMWGFLTLAIGAAGSLERVSPRLRWWTYVKLAIIASLLLMAMLTRHNAGFAAVPLMILAIARWIKKPAPFHRIAISAAIGLMVCVLLQFCAVATTEYLTTYKTNPWAYPVMFDVTGIIYRIPDHQQQQAFYARVPARLQSPGSLERMLEAYNPRSINTMLFDLNDLLILRAGGNPDKLIGLGPPPAIGCAMDKDPSVPPNNYFYTNCFELTEQERGSLIKLWSTLVIDYPLAWLSHRMALFHQLIGWNPYNSVYIEQHPVDWAKQIYGYPTPQLTRLQIDVKRLLIHMKPIFRPWIYLALTLFIIVTCLLSLTEERLYILLISASGLAHEGGLFFVAASAEYRFSHYMIYTSILGLLLLLRTYLIEPAGEPVTA
jgi:hypothetical protein